MEVKVAIRQQLYSTIAMLNWMLLYKYTKIRDAWNSCDFYKLSTKRLKLNLQVYKLSIEQVPGSNFCQPCSGNRLLSRTRQNKEKTRRLLKNLESGFWNDFWRQCSDTSSRDEAKGGFTKSIWDGKRLDGQFYCKAILFLGNFIGLAILYGGNLKNWHFQGLATERSGFFPYILEV